MARKLLGIHHVTAIAGDPQRNCDFYTRVLGLRLVKTTVNFDDPGTYHLYYGDRLGRPGTILTFFPWPAGERGRKGTGQATLVAFAVPIDAIRYWAERLEDYDIPYEGPISRFDDRVLTLFDLDDLQIELVGRRLLDKRPPERIGLVPAEYALRRVCGVTIPVAARDGTAALLTDVLGFHLAGQTQNRYRYAAGDDETGDFVDLLEVPGMPHGRVAVGNIHHVAWRSPDSQDQEAWRQALIARGISATPVMDRQYFRSVYFREPGGVLFEVATDPPGFTIDEPADELGMRLMLPPWLEEQRDQLERILPPLRLPEPAPRA